jgi:hypothetical protein
MARPGSWNVGKVGPFVAVAAAQRNYQLRRCLGGLNAKDIYSVRNNGAVAGTSGNATRLLSGLVAAQRPFWKQG